LERLFYRYNNRTLVLLQGVFENFFCKKNPNPGQQTKGSDFGGDEEDRTLDLTDANRTLSQLSYAPERINTMYDSTCRREFQELSEIFSIFC
jgi:hypothetical protein